MTTKKKKNIFDLWLVESVDMELWMWSAGCGGHVSDSRSYWYERLRNGQFPRPNLPGKVDGH